MTPSISMLYTEIPKYEELDQESRAIYHNDKEQYERIARKHGKSLLYAKAGSQEETWVPLIEKAYAKFHGNFSHLEGGWTREAIEDLTGYVFDIQPALLRNLTSTLEVWLRRS